MDNFSKTLNRNKYFYKIRNIDVLSWSTFFIPCVLSCLREREWSQAPVTVWVPDSCLVRTFQPSFCFSRPYPNPLFKVLQFRLVSNRNISSQSKISVWSYYFSSIDFFPRLYNRQRPGQ